MNRTADWDDVREKAWEIFQAGAYEVEEADPNHIKGTVAGDSGVYDSEIWGTNGKLSYSSCTCFPPGTKIDTTRGIKNIEDITLEDIVISHKGNEKKIIELQSREYEGVLLEIILDNGDKIMCTPNHPILKDIEVDEFCEASGLRVGDKIYSRCISLEKRLSFSNRMKNNNPMYRKEISSKVRESNIKDGGYEKSAQRWRENNPSFEKNGGPWNKGKTKEEFPQLVYPDNWKNFLVEGEAWNKGLTKETDVRIRKMGEKNKGRVLSKETRNKIGNKSRGRKASKETKMKMSISQSERLREMPEAIGKRNFKAGYYYSKNNGKVWYRSGWELAYMKYLDEINELWEYEKYSFDLGNCHYTPDFYFPNKDKFIEIKGRMDETSEYKINKFKELYSYIDFDVLRYQEMMELRLL